MADLEKHYRAYIDTINARGAQLSGNDLEIFVHNQVTHNKRSLSRKEYATLCSDAFRAIPDIHFSLKLVMKDGDRIAAIINFDNCHPVAELAGMRARQKQVSFSEHVFCDFVDGRISNVTSIVDWAAFQS